MRAGRGAAGLLALALWLPVACQTPAVGPESAEPLRLPGAPELPAELQQRMRQAAAREGPPRTRHLREDGSPKYTNRLVLESSPYLEQHAHNPVNWYPWGDEALADARRLSRPVLLSVGYSTCHWCHVMEEESFEDEEIAAYINAHYIPIKVDREERPELDEIYMKAVNMISGRGGWPMTVWLTPDGRPFFGGTYFPPRDGDRGVRIGFLTLLRQLGEAYSAEPVRIEETAARLAEALRRQPAAAAAAGLPQASVLDRAVAVAATAFDPVDGGRRGQPKFPSGLPLRLLLLQHRRTGDAAALRMVRLTLERMADGGIHDQVGGGFHRYSTDSRWRVPHFEKMLYDNALLARTYLEAWQVTGEPRFAQVARDTLEWAARDMQSPAGGFDSATDADSLDPHGAREEGRFFTWTPDELDQALGPEQAGPFESRYGVTTPGNFDGRSVLYVARPLEALGAELALTPAALEGRLSAARGRLLEVRARRPAPGLDDKVLASWNGLMISAMARGGFVLDEPRFGDCGARAAEFVLAHLRQDGRLRRSYRGGAARQPAYLDDYAFVVAGLLDLYETRFDPRWLEEALALQTTLDRHYWDSSGAYFLTADDHPRVLARIVPDDDGAEPSGNSVALMNLLRLSELTGREAYRERAERMLRRFSEALARQPESLSEMLLAVGFRLGPPREVAIVTAGADPSGKALLDVLRRQYGPARVVVRVTEGAQARAVSRRVPWVADKVARDGRPTAYVCQRGVCRLPITDPEALARELDENTPTRPDPEKNRSKSQRDD